MCIKCVIWKFKLLSMAVEVIRIIEGDDTGALEDGAQTGTSSTANDYLDGGLFAGADVEALAHDGSVISLPEAGLSDARLVGLYVKSLRDRSSVPEAEASRVVSMAIRAITGFIGMGVARLVLKRVGSSESVVIPL